MVVEDLQEAPPGSALEVGLDGKWGFRLWGNRVVQGERGEIIRGLEFGGGCEGRRKSCSRDEVSCAGTLAYGMPVGYVLE